MVQVQRCVDGYHARRPGRENAKKVAVEVLFRGFTMPRRWRAVVWWPGGVPDGPGDAVAVAGESSEAGVRPCGAGRSEEEVARFH